MSNIVKKALEIKGRGHSTLNLSAKFHFNDLIREFSNIAVLVPEVDAFHLRKDLLADLRDICFYRLQGSSELLFLFGLFSLNHSRKSYRSTFNFLQARL